MSQRRVVTEEVDGRSRVATDGPAPRLQFVERSWIEELWINGSSEPLGHDPTVEDAALTPPPGSVHWRIFMVPPDAELGNERSTELVGSTVDDDGWHRTDTLDFVVVLDGDLTLELDDGVVDLHAGDCVVQRRTNHAWRNRGERPVRVMAIMLGLEPEAPSKHQG